MKRIIYIIIIIIIIRYSHLGPAPACAKAGKERGG